MKINLGCCVWMKYRILDINKIKKKYYCDWNYLLKESLCYNLCFIFIFSLDNEQLK